jgi:arylformamidase
MTWQQMQPDERERAYSPSSCIGGNYLPFIQVYQTRSQEAYADCQTQGATWSTHAYGAHSAQRLLLCMPSNATSSSPVGLLVFIHGGYWQELSAKDSLFAASACVKRGLAFAALDYTLAPKASVADIMVECRDAMAWLFSHAAAMGVDAKHIVVAGSSAGANLAAMVALPGALPDGAGGAFSVHAAVLVSGIYELEPLVGTSINTALGLNVKTAQQASPLLSSLTGFPPRCCVGVRWRRKSSSGKVVISQRPWPPLEPPAMCLKSRCATILM